MSLNYIDPSLDPRDGQAVPRPTRGRVDDSWRPSRRAPEHGTCHLVEGWRRSSMSDLQTMKPCPVCGAMLTAALADAIANPGAPESCPTDPATVERARDTVKRAARVLITPTQRVVPLADLSLGGTMSNVSLSPKNVNTVSVNMQSNLDARKIVDAVDWNLRRRA